MLRPGIDYQVAVQGLDDVAAWADSIAESCRSGFTFVAYSGEDEREEGIGWFAIMTTTPIELTYEQAEAILELEYPY